MVYTTCELFRVITKEIGWHSEYCTLAQSNNIITRFNNRFVKETKPGISDEQLTKLFTSFGYVMSIKLWVGEGENTAFTTQDLFNFITSENKWYAPWYSRQNASICAKRFRANKLGKQALETFFMNFGYEPVEIWTRSSTRFTMKEQLEKITPETEPTGVLARGIKKRTNVSEQPSISADRLHLRAG